MTRNTDPQLLGGLFASQPIPSPATTAAAPAHATAPTATAPTTATATAATTGSTPTGPTARTPLHPEARSWQYILDKFSPKNWAAAYKVRGRTYTNEKIPTVGSLDKEYGPGAAAEWMLTQMLGFFSIGSDRDSERFHALVGFAEDFCTDCARLKLTDVMSFMSAYRTGRIGKSIYSATDPRQLGLTFHQCFLPQFQVSREMAVQRTAAERRQEQASSNNITFEEYIRQSYHVLTVSVSTLEASERLKEITTRMFDHPKHKPELFHSYTTTFYLPRTPEATEAFRRLTDAGTVKCLGEKCPGDETTPFRPRWKRG